MASGLSIVIDTRNAELNIKNLNQALERLENQGNSIANMMRNLGGANPFAGLTTSITSLKDSFNDFAGSTNTAKTAIKNLADGFISAKTAIDNAEASLRQFNQTAGANGLGRLNGALTAANNSLNQTNNTIHNTQNNFTQLNNNVNLTRNSLTALSSVVTNNTTVINNYNQSLNHASASAGHANGAFEQLNRTLSRLQALATGGIMGGMLLSVAKTADAMQGLENQVRLVAKEEGVREEVQRRLLVIANKNFADIEATTGSYQRNAFALAQLGKSQMDVLNFTDALSLAMRTGGRSMIEQKSAVYQLSQAMGAGKLQGDEYKSIAENAPILLKYIAKEMGVAQGALKELGSEGKITSEIIYNAMMKARPEMEKMAQSLPITMSQAWQQVNNSYKTFIDNFMNGTGGISQGIASMLQGIGANFGAIANIIGGVVVVALSKYVASTVAATIATTGFTTANLTLIGTTTIVNTSMRALSVFLTGVSVASRAASLATGALAIATTPVGVAFAKASASITAAAASLTRWSTYSGVAAAASTRLGAATVIATGAFARCAAILNAHPLMFLATVLFGVVASTEGVEGAMKSLGDAIGVVGYILSDFIKAGVQGFGYLLNAAGGFVAGMVNGTKDGANKGTANLGVFFENTRGGFVGILQGVSRMVDAAIITITSTFTVAVRKLENFVIGVKNAYNNIQGFFGMENKQTGYIDSSLSTALGQNYDKLGGSLTESLINSGIAQQDFQKQAKASADANTNLTKTIDPQLTAMSNAQKAIEAKATADKAAAKAAKEHDKAQRELLNGARLVGVSGNTGRSTGAHLDIRVSGGGRRLTDAELARFQAGGKQLSAYRKTSEYGSRVNPVTGKRHNHGGIDFAMPVGTPITTKVAIKDIKSFYDSKGGGYVQRILFADGLSVDLLHQSPKAQGIKGGASTGISKLDGMMSKLDSTYEKQAEKAAREQEQNLAKAVELRKEYGTKAQQIEADLAKKLEDIRNNTALSASEKDKFSTQAKVDAENELAIYRNTINQKISALLDFRKTQQQILDDKYAQDVFDAKHSRDLQGQDLTNYLDNLKTKYDFDTAANTANLQKQRSELDAYLKDERQLLVDNWDSQIDEARLKFDELSDIRIETLKAQKDRALEIFDLEQSQKLLDLQKFNMADIAYFEQTLKIKKDLIAKSNATPEMQSAQNAAADYQNRKDVLGLFNNQPENLDRPMYFGKGAEGQYQEAMYNNAELLRIYGENYAKLEEMGLTHSQVMIDFQRAYEEASRQSQEAVLEASRNVVSEQLSIWSQGLDAFGSVWGQMTDIVTNAYGKQSAAARAFFFVQKTVAAAQAIVNTEEAATKALAQGGALFGIPMANLVRASGYASAGIILSQGIAGAMGKGFSTGGYTGNMGVNDIAGVVHGKEYVLNAAATKRIGVDNLNAMNRGAGVGTKVIVNNYSNENATVEKQDNGDIMVTIGKMINDVTDYKIEKRFAKASRQGWNIGR